MNSNENQVLYSLVATRLPLDPILIAISELLPKVQDMQTSSSKASAVTNVLDLLKSVTLTHVLPERPAISARRFLVSSRSSPQSMARY